MLQKGILYVCFVWLQSGHNTSIWMWMNWTFYENSRFVSREGSGKHDLISS